MPKVAFVIPARNKAGRIIRSVRSALAQTYSPMEIILSDQCSEDRTYEQLKFCADQYTGPNKVRLLRCPHGDMKGMAGLNVHLNWLHEQTDADFIVQMSADDMVHPERTSRVVWAFEQFDPSMVLTAMYFVDPDLQYQGETPFPQESRFISTEEMIPQMVGGSSSQAWTHEFYDKIGGLHSIASQDILMPFVATLDRGAYFLAEKLHSFVKYKDVNNAGLGGVYDALEGDEAKRTQIEELMHFQVASGYFDVLDTIERIGLKTDLAVQSLGSALLDRMASWVNVRRRMLLKQVPYTELKVA